MASIYHVFGACVPAVGTGAANAFEALGVAKENGQIEIRTFHSERKSDAAGEAPADYQAMGQIATISLVLASYDSAVLAKIRNRSQGASGATAEGLGGAIGLLLGGSGAAFGLWLPTASDLPWYFPFCIIQGDNSNPGMLSDDGRLRFTAWRYVSPTSTTSAGAALYTRANPV